MIRLSKHPVPEILDRNAGEWTAKYVDHIRHGHPISDADKARYRHPGIKEAVRRETYEKCIYCESKVSHIYPGDVEHIRPKRLNPELFVSWPNLTYACSTCNNRKSEYDDPDAPLINPYVDDPAEDLDFLGPLVLAKPGSSKGRLTELRLGLSRAALVERRQERILALRSLIEEWLATPSGALKNEIQRELARAVGSDREYSAVLSAYVSHQAPSVLI